MGQPHSVKQTEGESVLQSYEEEDQNETQGLNPEYEVKDIQFEESSRDGDTKESSLEPVPMEAFVSRARLLTDEVFVLETKEQTRNRPTNYSWRQCSASPREEELYGAESPMRDQLRRQFSGVRPTAQKENYSKRAEILVIYTGGTIGMKNSKKGYIPVRHYLPNLVANLRQFNDKTIDNDSDFLVMPPSFVGKRIYYEFKEYFPLLDSCNMCIKDYVKISKDIYDNYHKYDGFVILHGTDTMAYTASALSFMLEHLGKPVIITGSQVPMSVNRNDGRENFFGALIIAGHYIIPEVLLFFNQKLFRGNRTTKFNAASYDAFIAPNSTPLVKLGVNIHVKWEAVFRQPGTQRFSIFTDLDPNVGVLRLFPGITTETVRHFLSPPMRGVVLQTYGAGNIPDQRKDIIELITQAVNRETLIVNISQCAIGGVEAVYATGTVLERAGVVGGGDMTVEAALAKLYYVLGKNWDFETKKMKMSMCMRGELTQFSKTQFMFSDLTIVSAISKFLGTSSSQEVLEVKRRIHPFLGCGAADSGDLETLRSLKETGVDMNAADYDGRTPLHLASANGDLLAVELLLSWGVSVHEVDRFGCIALVGAIKGKHWETAKLLINAGSRIKLPPAKLAPILCNYSAEGKVQEILLYHMAGADIFVGDYDWRTAMHIAASHGQKDVLKLLIEIALETNNALAKINIKDVFSNSPLSDALRHRHMECVDMLLKAGARHDVTKNILEDIVAKTGREADL